MTIVKKKVSKPKLKKFTWLNMMLHLKDLGAQGVIVKYSGAGDSGAIDSVELLKDIEDEDSVMEDVKVEEAYAKKIEERADKILENCDDWYNDDGGQGHIIINLSTGEYTQHHGVNYTETTYQDLEGSFYKPAK